ncbi:LRR receptor serine/threonine-protein kinase [Spatholobus suberectus]|nr:LRR receptor serine/threonine-protein kinase [Spatholobus suberectus]
MLVMLVNKEAKSLKLSFPFSPLPLIPKMMRCTSIVERSISSKYGNAFLLEIDSFECNFRKWRISAPPQWNISGEPCSGVAIDATSLDDDEFSMLIKNLNQNYLTGSLSSSIGNLSRMQYLYISSSGISGEIPKTFADLVNLRIVWATDIQLKGRIPEFIGNWSKLNTL